VEATGTVAVTRVSRGWETIVAAKLLGKASHAAHNINTKMKRILTRVYKLSPFPMNAALKT
jgi:hypothetical protein